MGKVINLDKVASLTEPLKIQMDGKIVEFKEPTDELFQAIENLEKDNVDDESLTISGAQDMVLALISNEKAAFFKDMTMRLKKAAIDTFMKESLDPLGSGTKGGRRP